MFKKKNCLFLIYHNYNFIFLKNKNVCKVKCNGFLIVAM